MHSRSRSSLNRSAPTPVADVLPAGVPFSWTFFCLAILHSLIYSLLVCESPAQAFLLREQANFTGLASICVETQAQISTFAHLSGSALLYDHLAHTQRTQEAEAREAQLDSVLHGTTQPPSLQSLAGSVSGTHFLGVFAFLPAVGEQSAAAAAGAERSARVIAARA